MIYHRYLIFVYLVLAYDLHLSHGFYTLKTVYCSSHTCENPQNASPFECPMILCLQQDSSNQVSTRKTSPKSKTHSKRYSNLSKSTKTKTEPRKLPTTSTKASKKSDATRKSKGGGSTRRKSSVKTIGSNTPNLTQETPASQREVAKLQRQNELESMCESSSRSGKYALFILAQEADKIMEVHKDLSQELGYEPSMEVWAASCSMPNLALERKITTGFKAKLELVQANMGLVRKALSAYKKKEGGLTLADLEQEGVFGLVRAVEKFDVTRDVQFSTYAMGWIKSTLRHAVAGKDSTIRIPYQTLQDVNKIKSTRNELTLMLDRQPTERELAKRLGWSVQKLRKYDVYTSQSVSSMDQPAHLSRQGEMVKESIADTVFEEDENSPLTRSSLGLDDIEVILNEHLQPQEREVIRLRYGLIDGEARTLVECADILGYSAEYVRRKAKSSIAKLQEALLVNGQPIEALSTN